MRNAEAIGLISLVKNHGRRVAFLGLLALTPLTLACYGYFPMTRAIYRTNGNIGGSVGGDTTQRRIVRSAAFWLFSPIYFVAGIADACILNVIEFWNGNVVEVGSVERADGTTLAVAPGAAPNEAVATVSRGGQVIAQDRYVRLSDGTVEVRAMDGVLVGRVVRDGQGNLLLNDVSGQTVRTLPSKAL